MIKDFSNYDHVKTLNLLPIILLPEHAYTRKILNYLVYTAQTGENESIRQHAADTIACMCDLLHGGNTLGAQQLAARACVISADGDGIKTDIQDHASDTMLTLDKEANKTPVLNPSEKDLENQHMKEPERDPNKNSSAALLAAKAIEERERIKEKIRKLA